MKMTREGYDIILKAFNENSEAVISRYTDIKNSGRYNVLESRVGWDCLRAFVGGDFISEQYNAGLNDTHITTAVSKAIKEIVG